jgi:4-amino-4-deoxy-L-arabinose transferase-like glycosyltransferase
LGGTVSDLADIANKFGPGGALITGVVGFILFYFAVPWLIEAWATHNKARVIGQLAPLWAKMVDEMFLRRFIHPAEWAGIAILLVCATVAIWKAITEQDMEHHTRRDAAWLSKLIARLFD